MYYSPDDQSRWTDGIKKLARDRLTIPGLHTIGYVNFRNSYQKLGTHYHHTIEFTVMLNGTKQFFVGDQRYILHGGDIFVTYPEEAHGNKDMPQEIAEYIWFQFDLSLASSGNFLGLTDPYSNYVFHQILNYRDRIKHAQKEDLPLLKDAFYQLASADPQKHFCGYSHFLNFISKNLCQSDIPSEENSCSPNISKGTAFIHAHLYDNLNIETIAEYAGLSTGRFKIKFKEEMGITPHAYILSLKINTAKMLLADPRNSITDIAYRLSFSSSNHFASTFKKHTGYTPTYYRKHFSENPPQKGIPYNDPPQR